MKGFPGGAVAKNPPANAGDPRLGWVENGNQLQYSCLENFTDREAWHVIENSWTWLSTHTNTHTYEIYELPRWLSGKEPTCQCQRFYSALLLGWEDPLEKEMATHSNIFTWEIPWTEEPGRLQSLESQKSRIQLYRLNNINISEWLSRYYDTPTLLWASQVMLVVKNAPANGGDVKRCGFDPWVWKIPWRRAWQPTPVFLPGESHRQRSLEGYSLWGFKELNMTEHTHTNPNRSYLLNM